MTTTRSALAAFTPLTTCTTTRPLAAGATATPAPAGATAGSLTPLAAITAVASRTATVGASIATVASFTAGTGDRRGRCRGQNGEA